MKDKKTQGEKPLSKKEDAAALLKVLAVGPVIKPEEIKVEKPAVKKEEVSTLLKIPASRPDDKTKRYEAIKKTLEELKASVESERKELEKMKGPDWVSIKRDNIAERGLYDEFERSRSDVKKELEGLHSLLGKYEEKIRYKDEAERELQSLEEIKVMLNAKLKNLMGRIEKIKVRKNSNLAKLFAEAKELDEEVRRSGEETLIFEKEYTVFLGMMGKLSG
ncbi:MAG: hypothetical protein NTY73_03595 [Candidatus Micrarchaeota archaeon]|nr:hypothetical protein [Candidatus Micrarchaeota archaeon]